MPPQSIPTSPIQNHLVKTQTGFTLIELLIVVAIIGILAAIAVPNFLHAQIRAKVAATESNLRAVATALEMYRTDNNSYPPLYAYGGTFNNYAGYLPLTTPVSYLSSFDATLDPFRRKEREDEAATTDNSYDQRFEYTPRKHGRDAQTPAVIGVPADMYFLEGVGPDGTDSIPGTPNYPFPPTHFVPYEASNGLISEGDIFRPGGVFVPEWVRAGKSF